MVNKRYMQKYDTCIGHEARMNKLLLKKPPGIMSDRSTSSVCEQCENQPIKGIEKKVGRRRGTRDSKKYKKVDGGVRRTLSPAFRRRIFGDGLRSMGSARVGCQILYVDSMLRRSGLGR